MSARRDTLDEVPPGSSLPAGRAAADREVNDPTLVRDASNKQPHPIGETRLSTASPAPHSAPPWSRFQTQASSHPSPQPATHEPRPTSPDPRLPKNVARNSPTAISTFEFTSLKFRGFQRTPKLTILELRATFEGRRAWRTDGISAAQIHVPRDLAPISATRRYRQPRCRPPARRGSGSPTRGPARASRPRRNA